MRIAYFLSAFPSTSETFVLNQIAGVMKAGHEVDIHAYHIAGFAHHPALETPGLLDLVHYHPRLPANKLARLLKSFFLIFGMLLTDTERCLRLFGYAKKIRFNAWLELFFLAWTLRGGRDYDVIHAHFGPNGLMAVRLRQAGFLQGNIVTSFHGFDANVVPNVLGKGYYRELFMQGDAFVVSSLFIKQKLLNLGCEEGMIKRIPVGVDVGMWHFKKRAGWQGSAPVLLSVGRLVEVKGFAYAIAAVAKVRRVFADVQYHLVGDGNLKSDLLEQVKRVGLEDCVYFLGKKNQSELDVLYQQADVFVMSSIKAEDGAEEGQGMVLFEAQAAGLPVVACDTGGIAESLPKGALFVPEKDSDALAKAMIAQLKELRKQGYDGSAGRNFVQENFAIDRLNQKTLQLYQSLT